MGSCVHEQNSSERCQTPSVLNMPTGTCPQIVCFFWLVRIFFLKPLILIATMLDIRFELVSFSFHRGIEMWKGGDSIEWIAKFIEEKLGGRNNSYCTANYWHRCFFFVTCFLQIECQNRKDKYGQPHISQKKVKYSSNSSISMTKRTANTLIHIVALPQIQTKIYIYIYISIIVSYFDMKVCLVNGLNTFIVFFLF